MQFLLKRASQEICIAVIIFHCFSSSSNAPLVTAQDIKLYSDGERDPFGNEIPSLHDVSALPLMLEKLDGTPTSVVYALRYNDLNTMNSVSSHDGLISM